MKEIYKALSSFRDKVGGIKKSAENPFFKSTYAPLSEILNAIETPLKDCDLSFTQIPTGENELKTVIFHIESGESIEGTFKCPLSKQDPQGLGSAITYMRRYALVSMLGLNIEEDDDGNLASNKMEKKVAKEADDLDL